MRLKRLISVLFLFAGLSTVSHAQFKEEAFSQNYNTEETVDTTKNTLFNFRELFGGLAHKRDARIGTLFAGALVMPGTYQIYNKDYWKLPIVYGGLAGCAGVGIYSHVMYHKTNDPAYKNLRSWMIASCAVTYWATLMDGVISYKSDRRPHPGKATLYSLLLPGLGQAYNGEYWKIPVYWGLLAGTFHFYNVNRNNYLRYRRIYNELNDEDATYQGPAQISSSTALYYRDVFRRYRDYSMLGMVLVYVIQIIDANVFAYMKDFEVTDDISLRLEPALIAPESQYAYNALPPASFGFRMGLKF